MKQIKKFKAFDYLLVIGLIWLAYVLLSVVAKGQEPPMPPSPVVSVKLAWDLPPGSDVFYARDTLGNPVPLVYRVYHTSLLSSTNSITNFNVILTTNWITSTNIYHTNIVVNLTNLSAFTPHFFLLSVSNHFLASEPSRMVGMPAPREKPEGFHLLID